MSQRYSQYNAGREPHSVSLKVLRLSRPSLATQFPVQLPPSLAPSRSRRDQQASIPASLAYNSSPVNNNPKTNNSKSIVDNIEETTGDDDDDDDDGTDEKNQHRQLYHQEWRTNPDPFILSPIVQLPPSFGSAYVGETFSCTLCANHDVPEPEPGPEPGQQQQQQQQPSSSHNKDHQSLKHKTIIRDVRIEAEMKTPSSATATKLDLGSLTTTTTAAAAAAAAATVLAESKDEADGNSNSNSSKTERTDLEPGQTLQKVVSFNLKEEGNHVLAATVSYYEATEVSGRTRTFRKLYQFICKSSLIVRTKAGPLGLAGGAVEKRGPDGTAAEEEEEEAGQEGQDDEKRERRRRRRRRTGREEDNKKKKRRWVLEAQLENCSEETMQLERVGLEPEPGLAYAGCNWDLAGAPGGEMPVLHPGDVEQVCFVVEGEWGEEGVKREDDRGGSSNRSSSSSRESTGADSEDREGRGGSGGGTGAEASGKVVLGILSISWRGEMGNRGSLSTGKLVARALPKATGLGRG